VHKQLGLGWEVEVDDIVQQRNVNAASSDVSDDHEVDLACAELAGVYLPGGLQCNSRHPEFTSSQAYDQLEQLSTVWFANLRAAALKRLPLWLLKGGGSFFFLHGLPAQAAGAIKLSIHTLCSASVNGCSSPVHGQVLDDKQWSAASVAAPKSVKISMLIWTISSHFAWLRSQPWLWLLKATVGSTVHHAQLAASLAA